jgi:hypothetical protein
MSKTIVFKPEIEAKLKKLRIKTKFVKNWIANRWYNKKWYKDEEEYIALKNRNDTKFYEEVNNWYMFIVTSFDWAITEEGHEYWSKISKL